MGCEREDADVVAGGCSEEGVGAAPPCKTLKSVVVDGGVRLVMRLDDQDCSKLAVGGQFERLRGHQGDTCEAKIDFSLKFRAVK